MPASAARLEEGSHAPAVSIRDLTCSIGDKVLLHPLSIDLPTGRSIALVGHNGSGKSTLLKLIGRQLRPSGGDVSFQGRPLQDWSDRAFARKLAYLQQHMPVAPGMLVRELVALGRYPWHGALGRFGQLDRDKVEHAMARTQITPFADRLVDTLSGGERQRVWIAMLIAQDAECLLLDEPISALDIAHQLDVLGLASELSHAEGMTVVTVLHDINMAARFCDWIVALREGRLIAQGRPEDIMSADVLEQIYDVRMEVIRQGESGRLVALAS